MTIENRGMKERGDMRIKQKDFAEHVKLFGVVGHVVKKLCLFGLAGVTRGCQNWDLGLFLIQRLGPQDSNWVTQ